MAIKIIKKGKKEFITACPICGCQFSYGLDDLVESLQGKSVICPCCSTTLRHTNTISHASENDANLLRDKATGNMVYVTPESLELQKYFEKQINKTEGNPVSSPCNTCSFYRQFLTSGRTYMGDSPCQYCPHNHYIVTCNTTVAGETHD